MPEHLYFFPKSLCLRNSDDNNDNDDDDAGTDDDNNGTADVKYVVNGTLGRHQVVPTSPHKTEFTDTANTTALSYFSLRKILKTSFFSWWTLIGLSGRVTLDVDLRVLGAFKESCRKTSHMI